MSKPFSEANSPHHERENYTDSEVSQIHDQLAREKEEPSEGFSPIPIFMLFLFSGVIFWAGVYMAKYSAGFSADYYDYQEGYAHGSGGAGAAVAGPLPPPDPARVYRANCQACHQADGKGMGSFPPLAGSSWVQGSEERLVRIVLNGLTGPITVDGKSYNSNMPGLPKLSDEQVAAVLTYVRSEWGNSAPAVTAETVAAIRATVGTREAWTESELDAYK